MAEKKGLPAKEIVADIRSGITDGDLARKYRLSSEKLPILFDKLVKAKLITPEELQARSDGFDLDLESETSGVTDQKHAESNTGSRPAGREIVKSQKHSDDGGVFCRNCGSQVSNKAEYCLSCGVRPQQGNRFCNNCGASTHENQELCVKCGVVLAKPLTGHSKKSPTPGSTDQPPKDWLTTLLLCIFLGFLGIHRFYTGHTGIGIVQLLTGGGCAIWTIIDLIMIVTNKYVDSAGQPLQKR